MVRILKPGGYVTFGQGYAKSFGKRKHELGGINSKNSIVEIFKSIKKNIDEYIFKYDVTKKMADNGERAILAVLKIKN